MSDNKLNKEELRDQADKAKVIASEKAAQAQEQAKKLKNVVESGVRAKDPKVLGGIAVAAVLVLGLMFGTGGTSLSDIDGQTFEPDYTTDTWMANEQALFEANPEAVTRTFHDDGFTEYNYSTSSYERKVIAWAVQEREDDKFAIYNPKWPNTHYVFSSDSKMCIEDYGQIHRCFKAAD
ncbi:hypothetical protein [Vibrio rhodolitus]|uniref:hypothetical protein n=1 Tax=Vibrio rhodolitus TaxID=2231649 RepID=UPI000E0C3F27|nr:hypothetical protein [Vibrio rhodolitus]